MMLLLLALNAPLYRFFWRRRGLRFAVQALLWHWFYYSYSGLAFAIGLARYLFHKWRSPRASLPAAPERWPHTERGPEL
jgi:hypothetical protein